MDNLTRREKAFIMAGLMLGMLVAALDQTIVGTAMPRIVASLGGMALYSWVFTAYMLTSTSLVPIFGKLSDIFGRRWLFMLGITVFMVGSWLSGASQNMGQLIIFRGLQGIGAAAIMPIAIIAIADIFPPAARGQVQGFMAGIWGTASVLGPTAGGYIVDSWSWRWAFYINIPIGILAIAVTYFHMKDGRDRSAKRSIDYWGVSALLMAIVPLLLALALGGRDYPWNSPFIVGLFFMAGTMIALFLGIERKAQDPIIPLSLFRNPIFSVSVINVFLTGMGMFGAIMYVPLFLQGVIGVTATNSGMLLTPMMVSLVAGSIIGGQLITRGAGYRWVALAGMGIVILGSILMASMNVSTVNEQAVAYMMVLGVGLGFTMPLFVIVVQNSVEYARVGVATSSIQFFRAMGGTIGVTLLGTVLANRLEWRLSQQSSLSMASLIPGRSGGLQDIQGLLDPSLLSRMPAPILEALRSALAGAVQEVFLVSLVLAGLAFLATIFLQERPLKKTWQSVDGARPAPAIPSLIKQSSEEAVADKPAGVEKKGR